MPRALLLPALSCCLFLAPNLPARASAPEAPPAQRPADGAQTAAAKQANAISDRMRQAEAMLEKGDYPAAEELLKQLAAATPGDARLQFDLGFTEEHNGQEPAATQAYAAAIAADGTMAEPKIALGLLEARLGHPEAARDPLRAAADLSSATPQLRGRALRALARLEESTNPSAAVDDLLRATQLTGEQPEDAELSASLARRSGKPEDAEAAYRKVLAADPSDVGAITGLAGILQSQGKLPEADALLRPAAAVQPENPQLSTQLAALDAAEGKLPEAITLLTTLRKGNAQAAADPAVTRFLAHLDLVSGDGAAAEPLYTSLLAADPHNPQLLDELGSTLVREQHFAEAETVLTRAVGLRPAFHDDAAWGETAGHLAFAASRNGDPKVALQALAARATVLPNSPASLFLEATAYDTLHRKKEAVMSYKAFLAMASGKLPDEEFEARHRLVTLEHEH